jgi:hypothetical protein
MIVNTKTIKERKAGGFNPTAFFSKLYFQAALNLGSLQFHQKVFLRKRVGKLYYFGY